ncbi:response regulator [Nitrospira moscoviensis]|uniref:Sensory response regulator n=1 Tax=Nitrospira moscoviensis TaxID=42253 RepID=A0A0K2G8C9_NITMO|nr:response regulator [Nitrospira moscoviensis]ALA57109.1 Sensory response regulator [Nitrospira moscoviensis]
MEQKPLALVADDDITLRVLAREALEQAGLRVEDAATGREALEAFQRDTPHIVLLDVMMPEMDGFAACAALRRLPQGENVPIMIMTELDDVESIAQAYDAGATDFITKPWNALILGHRVRYMLRAGQVIDTLREKERSLAEAQRMAHIGNWQWDLATDRFTASEEVYRILGLDRTTFPDTMEAYLEAIHPEDRDQRRQLLRLTLAQMGTYEHDHRVRHPAHGDRIVHEQAKVVREPGGTTGQVVGTIQDITDRRQAEAQIHFLSYYDQLTQLPNRLLFQDRVTQALALAQRHSFIGAVLLINLDRFQRINDTLGPSTGDDILKEVAQRLLHCVRKSDSVGRPHDPYPSILSRLGGDEFTCC